MSPNLTMWMLTPASLYIFRRALNPSMDAESRQSSADLPPPFWPACSGELLGGVAHQLDRTDAALEDVLEQVLGAAGQGAVAVGDDSDLDAVEFRVGSGFGSCADEVGHHGRCGQSRGAAEERSSGKGNLGRLHGSSSRNRVDLGNSSPGIVQSKRGPQHQGEPVSPPSFHRSLPPLRGNASQPEYKARRR